MLHDTILHLISHNYISQLTMCDAQGHKQICRHVLNLCDAGAAKMK